MYICLLLFYTLSFLRWKYLRGPLFLPLYICVHVEKTITALEEQRHFKFSTLSCCIQMLHKGEQCSQTAVVEPNISLHLSFSLVWKSGCQTRVPEVSCKCFMLFHHREGRGLLCCRETRTCSSSCCV